MCDWRRVAVNSVRHMPVSGVKVKEMRASNALRAPIAAKIGVKGLESPSVLP